VSLGASLCTFLPTGLFRIGSMQPALFFCSALYPGHAMKKRNMHFCKDVFSTPQAFLSILRISPHKNQNNFCDFIIPPHEKCKNLRGGADSGRGLPLDVFADLHKRIRGFSPAKTAGFLHKNGKRACLRQEAAGAPQIFKVFFPCQNYKITK